MKIIKIILLMVLVLWLSLEVFNFFEYKYRFAEAESGRLPPMGPVIYRPVVYRLGVLAFKSIFNIPIEPVRIY